MVEIAVGQDDEAQVAGAAARRQEGLIHRRAPTVIAGIH
jgi:hypothetical protein